VLADDEMETTLYFTNSFDFYVTRRGSEACQNTVLRRNSIGALFQVQIEPDWHDLKPGVARLERDGFTCTGGQLEKLLN
jgi:hypothetical protein